MPREQRLTEHASKRMQQRGFSRQDLALVRSHGERIADCYFFTNRVADELIRQRHHEIMELERLRGVVLVEPAETSVTIYRSERNGSKRLLKRKGGNVPMSSSPRKKTRTSFRISVDVLKSFDEVIQRLKLRRDTFLNDALWNEIEGLKHIEPNTEKGEEVLREECGRGELLEQKPLKRVNFFLDSKLLAAMSSVCKEKRIPRDIFLEHCLEHVFRPSLDQAAELIESPNYDFSGLGSNPYDVLSMTDEEVDAWWERFHEETLLIEAIARQKGVSVSAVRNAYASLSSAKQKQIAENPEVRKLVEKLLSSGPENATVDFQDLLSEVETDEKK